MVGAKKPADSSRANNKAKAASKPSGKPKPSATNSNSVDVKPIVKASAVVTEVGGDAEEGDEGEEASQAKTSTVSSEKEVQEPSPLKASATKTEKDADEEEEVDDEEGVGDPYLRYEKSTLKDQNCDPTVLENFYRKSDYFSCLTFGMGYCVQPTRMDLVWGGTGIVTGAASAYPDVLKNGKAARGKVLHKLDQRARVNAAYTKRVLEGKVSKKIASVARPLFVLEREAALTRTVGGVVVRYGARRVALGFVGGTAFSLALTAGEVFAENYIAPTGCAERDDTDPNFRKYVPLEKGKCNTPVYALGAPQVREFMELPLKEKLKILDSNRRICGFYRSMNEELDQRIAQLEGGSAVGKVSCDGGSGDISFSVRNDSKRKFTIKRKPGSTELIDFEYVMEASPGVPVESAVFDLVKTDFGDELTKIQYTNPAKEKKTIPYEEFSKFGKLQPEKAQNLIHAFRTTRKHVPQLIECCDKSDSERDDRKNRHKCPSEWFSPNSGNSSQPIAPAKTSE